MYAGYRGRFTRELSGSAALPRVSPCSLKVVWRQHTKAADVTWRGRFDGLHPDESGPLFDDRVDRAVGYWYPEIGIR